VLEMVISVKSSGFSGGYGVIEWDSRVREGQ